MELDNQDGENSEGTIADEAQKPELKHPLDDPQARELVSILGLTPGAIGPVRRAVIRCSSPSTDNRTEEQRLRDVQAAQDALDRK